jgi:cobalt-precorrin-5B (C1)-methyltransferase
MSPEPAHTASTQLRSGYTTGACAAAAAKGAALMLKHQVSVREVSLTLPAGVSATFRLHGQNFGPQTATCFVVKDAGDDPDITNGVEVHASVGRVSDSGAVESIIVISGGTGIGRVTKPGLAVPPGEWAINPVPRTMIEDAVASVVYPTPESRTRTTDAYHVSISIPDGEERSKKTLNARLGIIGGLSILGTTGIVRPISAKAWTDTIDAALDVARACGCRTVVLSTGRTSEMAAQKMINAKPAAYSDDSLFSAPRTPIFEPLPEEAFVMMGDHVAYALRACHRRGFLQPVLACQFAKLLKIACGHENTHAAASDLDLDKLLQWGREGGLSDLTLRTISTANTAREIAIACSFDQQMLNLLFQHARAAADRHIPGINPRFLVADYSGNGICYSN